jgi:hypothetical protein
MMEEFGAGSGSVVVTNRSGCALGRPKNICNTEFKNTGIRIYEDVKMSGSGILYKHQGPAAVITAVLRIRIRIGSAFNWVSGSGSEFRIQIQKGKNDPLKWKKGNKY